MADGEEKKHKLKKRTSHPGESKKVVFGRVGTNVKIGIVGLPNVGKSSLFNLLSKLHVPDANYPFCTIDPTDARIPVPDSRFNFLVEHHHPASQVPAFVTISDIAGLVRGASQGHGLGNAFLSHIRATDAVFHMLRAYKDDTIEHVETTIDPVRDLEIVISELRAKDKEFLQGHRSKIERLARAGDKIKQKELVIIDKTLQLLEEGKDLKLEHWTNKEIDFLSSVDILSTKASVVLVNMSKADYLRKKNKWLGRIQAFVKEKMPDTTIIPLSVAFEQDYNEMEPAEQKEICEQNKVKSMISKVIKIGYTALDLIHFFTSGSDEVKCWTIKKGTKAPKAAGTIHTDMERGFICAETMTWPDFHELGSEQACRSNGKYRSCGKEYVVRDGDIIFVKFNVSGKKK